MTPFLFFVEPTEAEFGPIRFEFATKFMMFTKFTRATFDPSRVNNVSFVNFCESVSHRIDYEAQ